MSLPFKLGSFSCDSAHGSYVRLIAKKYEACINTGRFIMFSLTTNIYNKKTKGPTLMEFFMATGKLKKFFDN